MKKIILILLLFTWSTAKSQLISFNFTGAAGNEKTYSSRLNDPNLSPSQITRSASMMRKPGVNSFNSSAWAEQITPDLGRYIEFTVSPLAGKKVTVTEITCKHQRSEGGPLAFSVRSNVDSYSKDISSFMAENNENVQTTVIDLSAESSLQNRSAAITFRIYGYRAGRASGTWGLGAAEGDHLIVNGASGTLPVVISSFHSDVFSEHIQLNWITESEHNSSHFNIYKSADGRSFAFKGRIDAAGSSTSARKYTFNDYDPASGINYYKLVEVDQNGENYDFGIIAAKIKFSPSLSLVSSTQDAVEILIRSNSASRGELTIADVHGRQLASATLSLLNGSNRVMLPLKANKMLLIARFESPEGVISKKFIKN
ncbi:hypothetical protein [Desertivirga xinjiangensis]|uniref:hypothetical protein n=1 Tax=Desertivirga xinjiangensis TaxID=539206 RepID=UPI00210A1825|nr:hypothetical protein [Pedobacter xinjiangensis]